MKRKQEEVENMRALAEKCRKFPGAKAIYCSKKTVDEKDRLLHVFSELPAELALEKLKGVLECIDQVLNGLSLVFDEDTFPSKSLPTCTRENEFDPQCNTLTSCTLPHPEIDRIHKTSCGSMWRCDECGEEWENSYYDMFDDVDVGHCFTGPYTAVVKPESDSDEVYVQKRQQYW